MKEFNIYTTKPEDEFDIKRIVNNEVYYFIKEKDRWYKSGPSGRVLRKLGLNTQEWYDKYILKIEDISNRPKCPICGEPCKFINHVSGYTRTCSFYHGRILCGKEGAEHHSEVMTEYYKNPNNRLKTSKSLINAYDNNPELRKKISIRTKEGCNKPGQHEKRSKAHILSWLKPTEAMLNPKYKIHKGGPNAYSGVKSSITSKYDSNITIYFDSNWEKLFYYDCTLNDDIVNLSRWRKPIKYVRPSDNLTHSYFPDFLLEYKNGNKVIIEIKPARLLDDPDTNSKLIAGKSFAFLYGYEYKIVTEENYDFEKSRIFNMPI